MLVAQEVPDGAMVVDCYQPLDLGSCLQLAAIGAKACLRYTDSTTQREVEWITEDAHMGILFVRTCRKGGWLPTAIMGTSDGQQIARAVATFGCPKGITGIVDHEGPGGTAQDEILYLNAAYDALVSYCLPCVYVGAGTRLTSFQLRHSLKMTRYMKSGSNVPDVDDRGYCMVQEAPLDRELPGLPGRKFDVSHAKADRLGGRLVMAVAS
jgi:hypothetical protein